MNLATTTTRSTDQAGSLSQRVQARLDRGLPPPAEAYHVHNRSKIDWTRVPEWARPSDPELFGDSGHEG
jgi:hypothetical protein